MNKCIYCLSDNGEFNSEEHIIPESLGNKHLILSKGLVCDKCNHGTLSILDEKFQDFSPIAFLKTFFVLETKQGNYPQARFQNVWMQKTGHNNIVFFSQDKSGNFTDKKEIENVLYSFKQEIHGKIFKPKLIARSLYKMGLGLIAYKERGLAECDRYDTAREFVLKDGNFPNNILIRMEFVPNKETQIKCDFLTSGGTIFYFDIYGLLLIINLEQSPIIELNTELLEMNFASFAFD